MSDKIYKMELHEKVELTSTADVVRVPGGWIYIIYDCEDKFTSTFVPFSNEFLEAWEK